MLNYRTPLIVQDGRKVTSQASSLQLPASRIRERTWILFHTQHRPICVSVQPLIVPQPIPLRRRFNLMKADWNGYSTELDNLIEDVEPIPDNYNCFLESLRVASRRHIPRGCRIEYVPGLTDESKSLYEAYKSTDLSNPFDDGTIE